MKRAFFPVLLLATALLSACTSTIHVDAGKSELKRSGGAVASVYVTNRERAPEYQILRSSGIYRISSTPEGVNRLTLHEIKYLPVCGNPFLVTLFTLGLIPVELPAPCIFRYELETNGKVEEVEHHLPLYERYSIWEWPLKWNQTGVYARALATSKLERRPKKSPHSPPR